MKKKKRSMRYTMQMKECLRKVNFLSRLTEIIDEITKDRWTYQNNRFFYHEHHFIYDIFQLDGLFNQFPFFENWKLFNSVI